jgi:hypothetical protein
MKRRRCCQLRTIIGGVLCASLLSTCLLAAALTDTLHTALPVSSAQQDARLRGAGPWINQTLLHTFSKVQSLVSSSMSAGAAANASGCVDLDPSCASWARAGECVQNPVFMNASCRLSCGLCRASSWLPLRSGAACDDRSSFCGQWAAVGECDSNPMYMRTNCPVTCHLCQSDRCHDEDTQRCTEEAAAGRCRDDPERMYRECKWTCKWCAMDTSSRCRRGPELRPAAVRGTIQRMFRRSVSGTLGEHVRPVVLSRDPCKWQHSDARTAGMPHRARLGLAPINPARVALTLPRPSLAPPSPRWLADGRGRRV